MRISDNTPLNHQDTSRDQIRRLLFVLSFAVLIAFFAAGAMFYWYGRDLDIEFKVIDD